MYVFICVYIFMNVYVYNIHTYIYMCTHMYINIYIHIYTYIYIYIFIHMYTYIYIYMFAHYFWIFNTEFKLNRHPQGPHQCRPRHPRHDPHRFHVHAHPLVPVFAIYMFVICAYICSRCISYVWVYLCACVWSCVRMRICLPSASFRSSLLLCARCPVSTCVCYI